MCVDRRFQRRGSPRPLPRDRPFVGSQFDLGLQTGITKLEVDHDHDLDAPLRSLV